MNNREDVKKSDFITHLISEEKEQSLKIFRQSSFSTRLEEQIKEKRLQNNTIPLWPKIAVPALGFLTLLAISIFLLRDSLIVSPFEKNINNIETILAKSTKIPAIQGHQQKTASKIHPQEIPLGAEWSFKSVLFSSQRKHIPIEEIPFLFSRVLNSTDSKIGNIPLVSSNLKDRDLLIEREKYRMEKTYHRFFSQIISKIQEEKNDS